MNLQARIFVFVVGLVVFLFVINLVRTRKLKVAMTIYESCHWFDFTS